MHALDDLLITSNNLIGIHDRTKQSSADAEVVDPFKQDDVRDPALRENIWVKPDLGVRAKNVVEDPIATDPRIENRYPRPPPVTGQQSAGQFVGITHVGIHK